MPGDDAVYYEAATSLPRAAAILAQARLRMFHLLMSELKPTSTTTILDIGASEHETREANFLEKLYPYPGNITCAGIGDGAEIRAANPAVNYIPIKPGQPLPFDDGSFDIAYSNAVLEHVGGPEQRRIFLKDTLRVARAVFMTVPNRWFPVEHHTGIPFLHYWPELFRRTLGGTRLDYWSHLENVDFLSIPLLRSEWPIPSPPRIVHTGIRLGSLSSNIAIIFRGNE